MEFYEKNKKNKPSSYHHSIGRVCPFCGRSSKTVFVHGHEQCVVCKINVEPCCQGEFNESSCLV